MLQAGHQVRRRHRRVRHRHARHRGVRGAVQQAGRLRDHVQCLEGVEAAQRGIALRRSESDHGFPDFYEGRLRRGGWPANPCSWARPCGGFELAAASPDEALRDPCGAEPGDLRRQSDLPAASARFMADQGRPVDADGKVASRPWTSGPATPRSSTSRGSSRTRASLWRPRRTTRPVQNRCPEVRHPVMDRLHVKDRLPPLALVLAILVAWEAYVRLAGVEPVANPGA